MSRHKTGLGRSAEPAQQMQGKDQGMIILSYLLTGIGLYGGLGWLADNLLHTSFLMVVGFIVGMIISFYIIIKRYGRDA
ncbi:hypothetical protein SDC9_156127 [bioreactor metagenome]|jgi:F0F1-type ATP synthase assembly protein I|uniref:ATP synthase protein I n=1 Tax=bioreactor metagenome TaxID=1076179 RepID=A0A645F3K8_9ZZZZ